MWKRIGLRIPLGVALVVACLACDNKPSKAAAPIAYKHLSFEYDVQADGQYTETIHSELVASNSSAAADIAQMPVAFTESLEDLDITEAYTLKANGKKLAVDTSAIFAQLQPGSPQIPMFDDHKQKVIVFPDVGAGDSIIWTDRIRSKQPLFKGQFTAQQTFARTVQFDDAQVIIRAPKTMPLRVEAHELKVDTDNRGDRVIYHLQYVAHDARLEDPSAVSAFDRLPRFFVSTFPSYDDFAHTYSRMIENKIAVTPKVQALADDITAGVTNRRQQAQKIYDWVSNHIRYVAITLGNSGVVPHDPDLIISNAYGDCKDHTVLFASLLKAKGIPSEVVIINGDNSYTLSEVPTLAQLNHAISWLPEFGLYADTTAGVAPFGSLPLEEYGKPVIHVVANGPAMRKTPVLPAGTASETVRTVAKLAADGTIHGTTVTTATGPLSFVLRSYALYIQANGPERVAKTLLRKTNDGGSGNFDLDPVGSLLPAYTITGRFDLDPRPRILSGESFKPPFGLQLLPRPGDWLMGPLDLVDLKDSEVTPCFSGSQVEEMSLELPAGKRVAALPKDTQLQDSHMHYSAHWALAGPFLTVRREFNFKIDQPLCTGETRRAAAIALRQLQEDYRASIALVSQ